LKASIQALARISGRAKAQEGFSSHASGRFSASLGRSQTPIKRRSDIDGLRAIAVLSVVLFHINAHIVPGGFIGVDIFFVISGFLITSIIAREMAEERFSFADFYLRRVRRILPAFWIVSWVTIAVGYVLLLPGDLLYALRSARAAAVFSTNIFFAKRQGYFAPEAGEQPFLHMWSLAVEEQFYFVWPMLLLGISALSPRFAAPHRLTLAFAVTVPLLILSFSVSEHLLCAGSGDAYYSLQSRAGELLIGALAAIIPFVVRTRTNQWLAALGLMGIAVSLFSFTGDTPFPGWRALFPTVSSALILYAGQREGSLSGPVARILSNSWLGYVGLLSYSLYLWHWPILAYMHYLYGRTVLPATWAVVAAALSLALSVLTYHLVEERAKRTRSFWKALSGYYVIPLVLLLAVSASSSRVLERVDPDPNLHSFGKNICHDTLAPRCSRGATGVAPRYLLIGDSHAGMLNTFIDVVGKYEGWSADVVSASSCSPVYGLDTRLIGLPPRPCDDIKKYLEDNVNKYDAVLFASYWALQLNMTDRQLDPEYFQKLDRTLRSIARDHPVYVFADIQLPPSDYALRLVKWRKLVLAENLTRPDPQETQEANDKIRKLVESIPNAHWVDFLPEFQRAFAPDGSYMGRHVYSDSNHLNVYGSDALAKLMIASDRRLLPPETSKALPPASK
jgi:peptidoglycan/LPS O-acetylase OafA/YrhL